MHFKDLLKRPYRTDRHAPQPLTTPQQSAPHGAEEGAKLSPVTIHASAAAATRTRTAQRLQKRLETGDRLMRAFHDAMGNPAVPPDQRSGLARRALSERIACAKSLMAEGSLEGAAALLQECVDVGDIMGLATIAGGSGSGHSIDVNAPDPKLVKLVKEATTLARQAFEQLGKTGGSPHTAFYAYKEAELQERECFECDRTRYRDARYFELKLEETKAWVEAYRLPCLAKEYQRMVDRALHGKRDATGPGCPAPRSTWRSLDS